MRFLVMIISIYVFLLSFADANDGAGWQTSRDVSQIPEYAHAYEPPPAEITKQTEACRQECESKETAGQRHDCQQGCSARSEVAIMAEWCMRHGYPVDCFM